MARLHVVATLFLFAAAACDPRADSAVPADDTAALASALTSGSITLASGNLARTGYDFSAGTYQDTARGDFYYSSGKFWANNVGQRGVISVGACNSVNDVRSIPVTGFNLQGVIAMPNTCYVARTHNDERDHIVFRTGPVISGNVSLTWKLVAGAYFGTTFVVNDALKEGYDFNTRRYVALQNGDFYYGVGAFWANNLGQRGVIASGPCDSIADVKEFPASDLVANNPGDEDGYTRWNVPAGPDACYVALMRNSSDYIVFQTERADSNRATITWKRVPRPIVDHCSGVPDPGRDVDCWLDQHPNVASALIWEARLLFGKSVPVPWIFWSQAQKADLRNNVTTSVQLLSGSLGVDPDSLVDPPPNLEQMPDDEYPRTVIWANDAWRLYVKTVAMSLAVELTQSVPWTVTDVLVDEGNHSSVLRALFDSRHMFTYTWPGRPPNLGGHPSARSEGYQLVTNSYDLRRGGFAPLPAHTTPAPPDKVFRFLRDNQLIGWSRSDTIERTLEWARRLRHADSLGHTSDFVNNWQYAGAAPVSGTIDGTVDHRHAAERGDSRPFHWTAGCWGTSEFLHAVLRTINIPVDLAMVDSGHAHPHFMTERLYLSHGDDPYFAFDPSLPAWTLLLSYDTFRKWFLDVPAQRATANVGRGLADASITYRANRLAEAYCKDPVPGADHANSYLLTQPAWGGAVVVPQIYTLDDLENLPPSPYPWDANLPPSLWDRLAQMVGWWGSCEQMMQYWIVPQRQENCPDWLPASERRATCYNSWNDPL